MKISYRTLNYTLPGTRSPVLAPNKAALTGKHDTLVRRAHQMLNAALAPKPPHQTPPMTAPITVRGETSRERNVLNSRICTVTLTHQRRFLHRRYYSSFLAQIYTAEHQFL